jgi:hypothetical protein
MAISKNWENLQSFLRKSYNKEVNEWFNDEAEGIETIKKVLSVTSAVYDADKLCVVEPKRGSENNPAGTELIYGKSQKKPRWRPAANVRFQYAVLTVNKLQYRIVLTDRSKTYLNALEWT